MLKRWMHEAGEGLTIEFLQKLTDQKMTSVDPSNSYWASLLKAFDKHDLKVYKH